MSKVPWILIPEIRKFLLDDDAVASIAPKDFEQVLRIVSKVSTLSPAELAEYKSRVTAKTTDWSVYEASLDRFIAERQEREATAKERSTLQTRLFKIETLYQRSRATFASGCLVQKSTSVLRAHDVT